jgi:serine/threonine protein phosphatase PrpC
VVLCSDGLWNYAPTDERMAAVVGPPSETTPSGLARVLVDHALACGGQDNVTVVVVDLTSPESSRSHEEGSW